MTPMAFPIGPTELVIILVILVVLFGGSRLAGLGKSSGRAIREFKEETKNLMGDKDSTDEVVDAEVVEPQQNQQQLPQQQQPQQQQDQPQQPVSSAPKSNSRDA